MHSVTRLMVLSCVMLCAGTVLAVDVGSQVPASTAVAAVKMIAVKIVDHLSHKPLAGLLVEVKSEIPLQCIRAPCGKGEQQFWRGTTDAQGVLHFPASLDKQGAIVTAYAVGSAFGADVHGVGKRDTRGRVILLLQRPATQ